MEKILPGRFTIAARLLVFAVLISFIPLQQAYGQEETSLPPEKAALYQSYLNKGQQYLEQGKYREAVSQFNRALLIYPGSDEAKRGVIKANQGIAATSAAPSPEAIEKERLNFHLAKGTEYYNEGTENYSIEKLDQAIAEWRQALQIDPENKLARSLIDAADHAKVDLLIEKGHDEFFTGNIDKAIEIWEEARQIVPQSKVLDDLIAEANAARHAKEMAKSDADYRVEMDNMQEFLSRFGSLPEGADGDGLKRRDISLKPPIPELKQFGAKEAIVKELSQPVAFEFECESLRGVLKFLTEITGINILVDEEIFEEFGKEEDCYGNKVERKEIFVTIHVSELPLESALNGMLRQHGLGFSIERDFIYVSTPEVLRGSSFEQLETRFYHLRDTSRISLPKLDTSGTAGGVTLGGRALNLASGQSLIGRLQDIPGDTLQELDPDFESMSVPKLVNILRSFIPVVLDPSKQTAKRTFQVGEDKIYGGFEKSQEQIELFEASRRLWADSSGREILSRIDFDPVTNTLVVRNTPSNLDMVEVFLDNFDKEPRQISVEAKFITYSVSEARKVGIDFFASASWQTDSISEGSTTDLDLFTDIAEDITGELVRGGNILFRFTKADGDLLQVTINLLSELRNSRIVSAPRLVTLHNKPAVIQDVTTQSFRSNLEIETSIVTPEAGQTTTVSSISQEFTDVTEGITLSITPQIQYDDTIRLWLLPDVAAITDVDEFIVTTATQDAVTANTVTRPRVARQSLVTNVVVNDGDTIVIGGLIRDTSDYQKTGVPFFRDIPLIGRMFENETEVQDSQNLLIFLTVNIMDARGISYTRLN